MLRQQNSLSLSLSCCRLDFWLLFSLRVGQGFLNGLCFPAFLVLVTLWSSPGEKAILQSMALAGSSMAGILAFPISSAMCFSAWDKGWPFVFYLPGIVATVDIITSCRCN